MASSSSGDNSCQAAALAAALDFQRVGGGESRRAIEPAGKNGFGTERAGLAGENDKHRLGNFLGQMRVADLPQRRRIDEIDVTRNQRLKGSFGLAGGVFPHQRHVITHHPSDTWTPGPKGDNFQPGILKEPDGIPPVLIAFMQWENF
jgi:hypothetical protein